MSILDSLCESISSNPRFVADYDSIVRESILKTAGLAQKVSLEEEALSRLMQSAAMFAQSSRSDWRQLAYRISIGALEYQNRLGGLDNAVRLTLARLSNYPAIKFAFKDAEEPRGIIESAFYEIVRRQANNTVQIGERSSTLTDLQKEVWDAAWGGASLALSAPTSSGKSFVFVGYIEKVKRARPDTNIVYLVPSRALISQVADDLREGGIDESFGVATVPIEAPSSNRGTPIYVLTPERLQVILHASETLAFDIVIVDEAHLIGDGARGVVLHSVLEDLKTRKPSIQFLFSSPQVRDPSIFGTLVGEHALRVFKTDDSPVAQNIILLKGGALDTRRNTLSLWRRGTEFPLVEIESRIPIYNPLDRLIYASWSLGRGSQSLVYAEGPAACEESALKIKDLSEDTTLQNDYPDTTSEETYKRRLELSNFAKEAVHPSFVLAETVIKGVGFHYGRIPALLRRAIEHAFSNGDLDYIVCTSTLLQGVNLPARNIFMHNPHKGDDMPMTPVDFWNLAGRAGRLGRDFQGNVYLIDYQDWQTAPLSGPKDEPVRPSLSAALVDSSAELLDFIENKDEPSGTHPLLEATFAKLLRDLRHQRLDQALDRLSGISPDTRETVKTALVIANAQIKISTATLDASPRISGYRQQQLYDYMTGKILERGPEYLIPLHPSAGWSAALDKLRPVFARVHKYLELKSGNHHRYWAPLALRWMRGEPLPRIIDDAIQHHRRQGRSRSNRTVIREVLAAVEDDLRFRYVNLLGCYTAILKEALTDNGFPEYVARVPSLPLYLELGAASQTMIQLMGLGLSRHTSSVISDLTINKDMSEEAARSYVKRLNPEALGLSPYVIAEIAGVLGSQ